ncbi:MAG: low molecular weight phosphotyrosine protein phosphatase [Epsilonproteobacteria bacterium]|nr:low molecular weight phosphotyrosine protein phosphatase [Campylobacterota bacterium]
MTSILFVCLGNICRSPLAEGIALNLKDKYDLNIEIDSAGTGHWHVGNPPCENSITVANNNHIDISHLRARLIKKEDENKFDYIVVMDENNYTDLIAMGFKNVYKIGNYGGFEGADVPDPYFFDGFEGFDKVFEMLDISVRDFMYKERLIS